MCVGLIFAVDEMRTRFEEGVLESLYVGVVCRFTDANLLAVSTFGAFKLGVEEGEQVLLVFFLEGFAFIAIFALGQVPELRKMRRTHIVAVVSQSAIRRVSVEFIVFWLFFV
jgi:arginine exporter protein ArgO